MTALTLITLAWAIEALLGYPRSVFERIGHPVTWMGRLIDGLDSQWNRANDSDARQQGMGIAAVIVVITVSVLIAFVVAAALPDTFIGVCVEALVASSLLASRSLFTHVSAVSRPLTAGSFTEARTALSRIVGRDTTSLDEPAIARAGLESLAENASDGVIAPVFWGVIFGLPGLAAYKAINTLDSMIGHRNARHRHFGRFAAQLDDAANWLPARLSGWLFCIAGGQPGAFGIMRRDARRHRSPNAGWPESALAASLGVRLSGPRRYGNAISDEPWLNASARDPLAADLHRGLRIYGGTMAVTWGVLAARAAWVL